MKKRGRSSDQALMRTAANKKAQTFAHKRLFKDLEQIVNQKIPTVGVTARPLEHDLFIWHANIKGPEGTFFEGGVFHLQMRFPQSYPHHPPTIQLYTTIPHPNVFGNYICLDMIQCLGSRSVQGQGWSSAYSVQSILFQLQSFLSQQNLTKDQAVLELQIKKAVKEANNYKCNVCKHGGKLSLWPTFSNKEQDINQFVTLQSQNDLIKQGLICFHTKQSFKQKPLGLGLKVSKIPRTGNIRQAQAFYDYISIKAFVKDSIHLTSANQRITHWLPVYFGQEDNQERFFFCFKKAISMIMTNSTKNFKPQLILEVLPKIMITTVYHIMSEQKHASIRLIRILSHLHSIFLYSLSQFPELQKKITQTIKNFLASQQARTKDNQANLGCILAYLTAVDSYKFDQVSETYFSEQLDRQVLWILKSVPQLLDEKLTKQTDQLRTKTVFKSQMTSFQILCFYKLFITEICQKRKNKKLMLEEYKSNLCKFTNKEEDYFQSKIFQIQKKVLTFNDFFKYVGLKHRQQPELLQMLKNAIKNSQRKKYHGEFEVIHELPKSQQQFKKLLQNVPSYRLYIDVTSKEVKEGNKKQFIFEIKEKNSKDEDWKKMCIDRWSWVKEVMAYDSTLNAKDISLRAISYAQQGIAKPQDRLIKVMKEKYLNSKINYNQPKIEIPNIDWKRLFLRLDLEDFLLHIDMNPDFHEYYEKLEICKLLQLNTILIPIIDITNVKSGHYYLTALLSKLTTLKYLEFSGLPNMHNNITQKTAKAIKKGFTNFAEAGGRIQILSYYNLNVNKDLSDNLFNYLREVDTLTSLRFVKTNFFNYGACMKVISHHLTNIKDVQQIKLIKCNLNAEKCKVLADSLMRMKKLKILQINDNSSLGTGLSSIIYNLAFSPNLLLLDISQCNMGNNNQIIETVVSIQKLLKISASIEIFKASRMVPNINSSLSKQFWIALGQCRSLRVVDLANSGDLSNKKTQIGNSIAFNAKKKGALQYLNLTGAISYSATLDQLYKGMMISQYDQQRLYGDPNKLAKMIPSNYKPVFYNNLKALQLDNCKTLNPNFTIAHFNKLIEKQDPDYVKLFAHSPNLQTLTMVNTGLQKNFADIMVLALDPRRTGFASKIKILNLSKNNLGKQGIKLLGEVLPHNNILEVLDLSKNKIGVSGAHELSVALQKNKSLKYLNIFNNNIGYDGAKSIAQNIVKNHQTLQILQVGHNRIRDKGLKVITDCLLQNKNSSLKILGLRFNFLTTKGITYMYNKLSDGKTKMEEIFIRNNLMDDHGVYSLSQMHEFDKSKLSIDLLAKIKYLEQQKSERTVWIHPITGINLQNLKKFFQNPPHKCGIVLDIRVRRGKKYPNKTGDNLFGFVQFADATSVTRALHIASKRSTMVDGVKFRIFKAGTGTFSYVKKTAKQKKIEFAFNTLPPVPYGISAPISNVRGGDRRGRGRGRGGPRR